MRFAPRPSSWSLALLVPLALTSCNGEDEKASTPAPAEVANAAKAPEAPKVEPGDRGYVIPAGTKPAPPLLQAAKRGNLDAVKALLDGGVDANVNHESLTALHIAAGEGLLDIARVLLEKGADTSARQQAGATPLHIAASVPTGLEMVKLLIEHKAEVDALDKRKRTALVVAASNGHVDIMHVLLDKGADPNLKDVDGATALHAAVGELHKEAVAALLARGAQVNAADGQKNTPLHYAARFDQREIAELLLANGADILAKTVEGGTAFQLAGHMKHEDLAKYLFELEKAAGGPAATAIPSTDKPAVPPQRPPPQKPQ